MALLILLDVEICALVILRPLVLRNAQNRTPLSRIVSCRR